jgi:hypothetical protein
VRAIAEAIPLSPQRETLLTWTVAHDPTRVPGFLSPSELFLLGGGDTQMSALDAWGMPATSRTGCLCLQVISHRSWETFAGRWNTGMLASAFPDLNFRIAEILSELQMPAVLLAPILTSATLDFVNSVTSRDQDDRRDGSGVRVEYCRQRSTGGHAAHHLAYQRRRGQRSDTDRDVD